MFPHYKQIDSMDCGPACLRNISKYYGKSYPANQLRELCHITKEGVSLLGISDAAEAIGFHTTGLKITWEQLVDAPLPCIAHWNQRHFIVVYDIKKKRRGKYQLSVSDPAEGLLQYTDESFKKSWLQDKTDLSNAKGVVLLLEPTNLFYNDTLKSELTGKRLKLSFLANYLRPHLHSILQLFLAMMVSSLLNLLLPFISQAIVDKGVGLGNITIVKTMLIAQVAVIFGQLVNNLLQGWLMLHTSTRISIALISDFIAKLMRLPIAFFDTKLTGDIMQRVLDHSRIQNFLTKSLLSIILAAFLFVFYGIVLGGYNLTILGVFLIGSSLYVAWVLSFLSIRKRLDYKRFQQAAANQSSIFQLINGMQEIKLNCCERQKRWEWEIIQAKLFKISIKGMSLSQVQQIGGTLIDQAKNVVISFLSAKAVIDGQMSLGMMVALQYIIGQLNAPVSQLISFAQQAQDASISMERLGEIHNKPDEEDVQCEKRMEIKDDADIELRDVTYQYEGPRSTKVLDGISVKIPSNKITALVGTSGSGKTTLLKMLLGFYQPVEGKILLGGFDLSTYSDKIWRHNSGCVMQDGFIFSNTIKENIAIGKEHIDMDQVREAAHVACIDSWIEELPLGYNTMIGSEGHGLSMGQRQRLLIARAVYKNPKYLFLDEATNSLDANNERLIMDNLETLFVNKTVVVIAHRLSTVKNADKIIVLDSGKIVEEGTHKELVRLKGKYYELVQNQLELGR